MGVHSEKAISVLPVVQQQPVISTLRGAAILFPHVACSHEYAPAALFRCGRSISGACSQVLLAARLAAEGNNL